MDIEIIEYTTGKSIVSCSPKGENFMSKLCISGWLNSRIIADIPTHKCFNIIIENAKKLKIKYQIIQAIA